MNRMELEAFIFETYAVKAEFPWERYPSYMVFRHSGNQKWFALVMRISKEKLGLQEDEMLDILDVKCDPIMIGSLRMEPGFYPAYHMNQSNWITIALDGSVSHEKIKMLLDISFDLTDSKGVTHHRKRKS